VNAGWRGCIRLVREEIAKCVIVCANCHAVRTFVRREQQRAANAEPSSPSAT